MKPKRIENWEKIRQKGPWRYGLIYGTLWGIFVVAFVVLIDSLFGHNNKVINNIFTWTILYVVTGIILYRFFMWKINEKYYQKWLSDNQE